MSYSAACSKSGPVCHPEPQSVWWVGFDCAHSGDRKPGFEKCLRTLCEVDPKIVALLQGQYRDFAYVRAQVVALAAQAKSAQ